MGLEWRSNGRKQAESIENHDDDPGDFLPSILSPPTLPPALLPPQLAEMVTQLAWLARVSLKTTSFFIELILETAKYSTGFSLGITRRALISAVGTARAMHAIAGGENWDAQSAGKAIEGAGGTRGLGRATK